MSDDLKTVLNAETIMISYKTECRDIADEVFLMLDEAGLVPWMDYRGIEPGMKWRDELMGTSNNRDSPAIERH